jgi:hypothetical protein
MSGSMLQDEENRNTCKILIGKAKGTRQIEKPKDTVDWFGIFADRIYNRGLS